ncbi:unnamed protein product [Mytilus coruscus]|uniref:Uncharacterized protein n=1 Tax=Mytilus coruscus TaxID=42192 RepID=A0A6J8BEP6_MYTCO|nr:unnamed protein product [Mytilus coruscus]
MYKGFIENMSDESKIDRDRFAVFTSVPNLLAGYGINSEDKFEEWMGTLLTLKTGDPDIKFGEIVFRELVNYLENAGISLKDMYLGHTRRQVTGVFSYVWHIAMGMHENTRRIHFKNKDVDRTVGINTTGFDVKEKDKDFMVDQGERSTLKYLNSYVEKQTLPKVSAVELKNRKIPMKTRN